VSSTGHAIGVFFFFFFAQYPLFLSTGLVVSSFGACFELVCLNDYPFPLISSANSVFK